MTFERSDLGYFGLRFQLISFLVKEVMVQVGSIS